MGTRSWACRFQVVRTAGDAGACSLGELVVEADDIPPAGDVVAWRVTTPLDRVGHYCWRHQCCDETSGCGGWSDWFPFSTNAPAACPRGIRLLSPDGDERIDWTSRPELPLTVDNADVPEGGQGATEVLYQVFSAPGIGPDSLVFEATVEEGAGGRTTLSVLRGDERHQALVALLPGPGGERTFYWRAQAVAPSGCESEWTGIGRFVLYTPPPLGPCGACAVGSSAPWAWVLLLPVLLLAARRRRRRSTGVGSKEDE